MGLHPLTIGLRRLRHRPAFTSASVLLVSGTIAISMTIGTIARQTLFAPLPYPQEGRLVALYWSRPEMNIPDMSLSLVVARELTERSTIFEAVAATNTPLSTTLTTLDGPVHLSSGLVMPQVDAVLGINPLLGRSFTLAEGEPGSAPIAAILSYDAWQTHFAGDADVLGTTLVLGGDEKIVVGVLPPGRSFAPEQSEPIDVWLPMGAAEQVLSGPIFSAPGAASFRVNAKLAPGRTLEELDAELLRLQQAIASDYPATHDGWLFHADPLRYRIMGQVDDPVAALFLGSLLLSAVALVNLTGLFLQRAEEERTEIATRVALGATAADLLRLRGAEATIVGTVGGVAGFMLLQLAFGALKEWDPFGIPAHVELGLAWGGLPLSMALALAACLVAALVVSLLTRSAADGDLRPANWSPKTAGPSLSMRSALTLQVALTTALAIGAITATRSLVDLRYRDTGLEREGILSARMDVPRELLDVEEVARRARNIVAGMRARPDVADAFLWSPQIPAEARTYTGLHVEGYVPEDDSTSVARYHTVSPGAATAFGLQFIAGRDMSEDDWRSGRRVAVVSVSAAELWWGGVDEALGRHVQRTSHDTWSEIVGVVADAKFSGRYGPGSDNTVDVFFMFDQDPRYTLLLFARPQRDRIDVDGLRSAVAGAMPELPLYDVRWMDGRLSDQELTHRSMAGFANLYAVASLLLAAIGLSGVTVAQLNRQRVEIGIRQALGGPPGTVVRQLLASSVITVSIGLAAGIGLARFGLSFLDPVLLTVGPTDAVSYLGGIAIVIAGMLAAMLKPAITTFRASPSECLHPTTIV